MSSATAEAQASRSSAEAPATVAILPAGLVGSSNYTRRHVGACGGSGCWRLDSSRSDRRKVAVREDRRGGGGRGAATWITFGTKDWALLLAADPPISGIPLLSRVPTALPLT